MTDLWPHMVMLDALIHHHEATADPRVIPLMTRFFEFCRELPDDQFLVPRGSEHGNWKVHIQYSRAGDLFSAIYWLYNHTGEPWLLELAARVYSCLEPPQNEWLERHVVSFTQRFRYPAEFFQQSRQCWHLDQAEYWYRQHMGTWGQQPRGIFAADECIRPGKDRPAPGHRNLRHRRVRQELLHPRPHHRLDPLRRPRRGHHAQPLPRCLRSRLPRPALPDGRQSAAARRRRRPRFLQRVWPRQKGNPQLPYSPHVYRCCQHNVAMGWPWYAQNLWQATSDNGLCAWLYAASEVTAKVGPSGDEVAIQQITDYPFDTNVELRVCAKRPSGGSSPCISASPPGAKVCAYASTAKPPTLPPSPANISASSASGPMATPSASKCRSGSRLTQWPRTGAVTVDRGPLSYSVRIGERWQRFGGTEEWPVWEVYPTDPWNYALAVDRDNPASSIEVAATRPVAPQPWTLDAAPIELKAKARRVPTWTLGSDRTIQPVPSPGSRAPASGSTGPTEDITLIPLGCARLRVSCLPTALNA